MFVTIGMSYSLSAI